MLYLRSMNVALIVAASLSLITWAIHTFLGGREVARPLLRSSMKPVPKYTNYYCWHLVTLTLAAMTAGFAYAALVPAGLDVALLMTALSASFCIWSLALVLWKRRRLLELPQWSLFLLITVAAVIGLV